MSQMAGFSALLSHGKLVMGKSCRSHEILLPNFCVNLGNPLQPVAGGPRKSLQLYTKECCLYPFLWEVSASCALGFTQNQGGDVCLICSTFCHFRYESNSGGEREIQRTMLELLNQLDGFDSKGDVKVIMATNRIETLDPALIRPGKNLS